MTFPNAARPSSLPMGQGFAAQPCGVPSGNADKIDSGSMSPGLRLMRDNVLYEPPQAFFGLPVVSKPAVKRFGPAMDNQRQRALGFGQI